MRSEQHRLVARCAGVIVVADSACLLIHCLCALPHGNDGLGDQVDKLLCALGWNVRFVGSWSSRSRLICFGIALLRIGSNGHSMALEQRRQCEQCGQGQFDPVAQIDLRSGPDDQGVAIKMADCRREMCETRSGNDVKRPKLQPAERGADRHRRLQGSWVGSRWSSKRNWHAPGSLRLRQRPHCLVENKRRAKPAASTSWWVLRSARRA